MPDQTSQQMQCMEVWGGSQLTAQGVEFGGLDAWVYSKPFGDAKRGGDVYYASSCATGRISRLLLADVSGHGDSVASTAADLRTLMRRFVNHLDQGEFVRLLNGQFSALSRNGSFATAVVTTYFAPSRRLTVCNAGHPRPLLYRAGRRHWSLLSHERSETGAARGPRNIPLGMIAISEYEQFDVELEAGDCLLAYTDALIESSDADGEMLGEHGLLRIMRTLEIPASGGHFSVDPRKITEQLLAEIAARYPANLTNDDVTVLIVRASDREPNYSAGDKLKAVGRFIRTLIGSLNPGAERAPFPDTTLANMGGAIFPALARRWRAPREAGADPQD